jgi:hypothetical protein
MDPSFNSLSRDHITELVRDDERALKKVRLSTPSLGITLDERPDIHDFVSFQLPLSGSPSPIPGFFGSPRLSAAAPLRTNDS